jgi:hypothetical protein
MSSWKMVLCRVQTMVFPWEQIVCFRVNRQAEEKKAMAAAAKSMGKKKSFGPADFRKCQQLSRFNELVELINEKKKA